MTPDQLPPRMSTKVRIDDAGCWIWTGARQSKGYGCVSVDKRIHLAHRIAYKLLVGPIPEGMQIDHLCRVRQCVNPTHLEPVTPLVNVRRATDLITHCPHGHAYDEANTFLKRDARQCRACARVYKQAWNRRQRTTLVPKATR